MHKVVQSQDMLSAMVISDGVLIEQTAFLGFFSFFIFYFFGHVL